MEKIGKPYPRREKIRTSALPGLHGLPFRSGAATHNGRCIWDIPAIPHSCAERRFSPGLDPRGPLVPRFTLNKAAGVYAKVYKWPDATECRWVVGTEI